MPKKIRDKIYSSRPYKQAQERQKKLNKLGKAMRSKPKSFNFIHSYANALMALGISAVVAYVIVYATLGAGLLVGASAAN